MGLRNEPGAFVIELFRPGVDDVRAGTWSTRAGVRVAEIGEDHALAALAAVAARGTVVSHRGGKRAVVRLRDDEAYVKVVRPSAVAAVARAATVAAPFCAGFRIALPEEDASLPAGAVRFPALPGRTLHALGADRTLSESDWDAICAGFAEAWCRAFPALSAAAAGAAAAPGRTHDGAAEGRIMRAAAAGVAASDPDLAAALAQQASQLASRLVEYRGPLVLAHRDLHDKQILWRDGVYALLDVDTAAFAEPALDLGNLCAEACLRVRQGVWSPARAARLCRRIEQAAAACGVLPTGSASRSARPGSGSPPSTGIARASSGVRARSWKRSPMARGAGALLSRG